MSKSTLVPVAQYLRMSTDQQQYSLRNQADATSRYAGDHGLEVVRSYSDPGKSGLRLTNRRGLQQLLRDVVAGSCPFKSILVYDVSRWGRFQDSDEAAHYEFLCKSARVPVIYCAETFPLEAGMPGGIMKAMKRLMAGEYSRELSVKVRAGLVRIASLGYKCGGTSPYGLRRMLLDRLGNRKQILGPGERKSLTVERVILVPGPSNEVEVVKRIFRDFTDGQRTLSQIAAQLNQEGIPCIGERPWHAGRIRHILSNPTYAGTNVWGRTAETLSTPARRLPPVYIRSTPMTV